MVLSIDPSINDIGLALLTPKGEFIRSWHIKSPAKVSSVKKVESISQQLKTILEEIGSEKIELVLIEHTRFFSRNNNSSHASAQKLNLAKGVIFGTCNALLNCTVQLVWIPGFNKQQAQLLARSCKAPNKITQHEVDAFWLGNTWTNTSKVLQKSYLEQSHL